MKKIMNLFRKNDNSKNPFETFSITILSSMMDAEKNILISPCRLMSLLSFLYEYGSKESKRQIEMLLGIDFGDAEIVQRLMCQSTVLPTEKYESWVRDDDKQIFKAAICSSLWIDPSIEVSEEVGEKLRKWGIEKKVSSFSSNELQKEIRDYVAMNTNGQVKKLSMVINPVTKGVLIDCLYFKGKWRMTFDTEDTKPDTFFGVKKRKTIPFMKVSLMFGQYYACHTFYALNLSYICNCKARSYSMRIYLPKEDKTCLDVLRIIKKRDDSFEYKTKPVNLHLPKFSLKSAINYGEVLKKNGIEKIQIPLSQNNQSLVIDDIIQQGTIRVSEKGTEAGVATCTTMDLGMPRKVDYLDVKINRPFIFEIVEDHSKARLFAGVVNQL